MAQVQRAARERSHHLILQCVQEAEERFDGLSAVALNLLSKRLEVAYERANEANIQLQGVLDANDADNDTAAFMGPVDTVYNDLSLRIAQRLAELQAPAQATG